MNIPFWTYGRSPFFFLDVAMALLRPLSRRGERRVLVRRVSGCIPCRRCQWENCPTTRCIFRCPQIWLPEGIAVWCDLDHRCAVWFANTFPNREWSNQKDDLKTETRNLRMEKRVCGEQNGSRSWILPLISPWDLQLNILRFMGELKRMQERSWRIWRLWMFSEKNLHSWYLHRRSFAWQAFTWST